MSNPWLSLGLDSCLLAEEKNGWLYFIRLDPRLMVTVSRLLGHMTNPMSGLQSPLLVTGITREQDGTYTIDAKNRALSISKDSIIIEGHIKVDPFMENGLDVLKDHMINTMSANIWRDEEGIHTTDGKTHESFQEAIIHGLKLTGRKMTDKEKYDLIDSLPDIRKPRADLIVLENDEPPKAKKPKKEKCKACGDRGYIMVTAIRDGIEITEVQRCDACEKYDSDASALKAAVKAGMDQVLAHLDMKIPDCKNRARFKKSKTDPTVCMTDPVCCLECLAETIEEMQEKRLSEAITKASNAHKPKSAPAAPSCKSIKDCTEIYVGNCDGCPIVDGFEGIISEPKKKGRPKKVTIRLEQDGKVFKRFQIKKDYNMDDLYAAIRKWAPAAPKPGMFDVHTPCGTSHVGSREDRPPTEQGDTKNPTTKDVLFVPKGAKVVDIKDKVTEDTARNEENAPCISCGAKDKPLHTNYHCPDCFQKVVEEVKREIKKGKLILPPGCTVESLAEGRSHPDVKLRKADDGILPRVTDKYWKCNCDKDNIKQATMVRCIKCNDTRRPSDVILLADLDEFQRVIAKGAIKINFEEWDPDDIETFIVEVAKGMEQPFGLTELVVELSRYGMEPDAAREEVTKQWREGGTVYGVDSYRLKVTVVDQENYTAPSDQPVDEPDN